jgi:uncharacterized protein (DUF1697 family)
MAIQRDPNSETYIALLYSVVLGKGRRVVMSDLKVMAEELGLSTPRTVAATGNLVVEAAASTAEHLESALEAAFETTFGRHVDIIVRRAADWPALMQANPFVSEAEADPSLVAVRVMRTPLTEEASDMLTPYLAAGELMAIVNGDLWVHFAQGNASSKLASASIARRLGIGTWRNWNTVCRLGVMVG